MSDVDNPIVRRALARVGTVLRDKWRLERLVGVGGMAAVYAARHRNGQRGAVKMLHLELSLDEEACGRFLREGYVANKVDHPAAVSVLDDDIAEDGAVFLVMELLDGETLDQRAGARPGGRLDVGEVLAVADALLELLEAAHARGILHRDLKPENVFVTTRGELKVLDFGIARLRGGPGDPSATKAGSAMGTPAYMAPEQALGDWDVVDERTDLWSVGATMFALLTGRHVHEADTFQKLHLAAMTRKAPPLASLRPGAHPLVATVVDRALAFDQSARWPDAKRMRAAVQAARAEHPGAISSRAASLPAVPLSILVSRGAPPPVSEETPAVTDSGTQVLAGSRRASEGIGNQPSAVPLSRDPTPPTAVRAAAARARRGTAIALAAVAVAAACVIGGFVALREPLPPAGAVGASDEPIPEPTRAAAEAPAPPSNEPVATGAPVAADAPSAHGAASASAAPTAPPATTPARPRPTAPTRPRPAKKKDLLDAF